MRRNKTDTPKIVTGTLRVHARGFGFLIPDERELFPVDIFIPAHATAGAVDGDTVEISINNRPFSPKGPDGWVTKILRRGRSHAAGIITHFGRDNQAYAYVPLLGEEQMMRIEPSEGREFQIGDRIIIRVLQWGSYKKESLGQMSAYIGHISDPSCDVIAAVEEYDLDDEFSEKILMEANHFGKQVSPKEMEFREDFTDLECFTIDPETARDFDDALSLTRDKKKNFHLGVHIADVSHYVREGSSLDREASKRCNSVYLPGHVLPMLPHALSSHLCSLKPNVNRLTLSVLLTFDESGELIKYGITRSVIRSKKRFSYQEAKEVLDGKKRSKHADTLHLMVELCNLLKKKRTARGSIEFALPDISIKIDDKGLPLEVTVVEYDITHQLVEEFMLKANEIVAYHLCQQGKLLTYRTHDQPNPDNIREFAALAKAFGFKITSQPTNEEIQQLFNEARESPFGQFLATAFIRSMKLANYSTQNIGHYGLGLEYYTHFTSPIRRYIDLVIHRLLFDGVSPSENLEKIALACSDKERLASKAENSVILLKKLRLLQMRQKSDPHYVYDAVVTQSKPNGIVFAITELLYEGYLPIAKSSLSPHFRAGDKLQVSLQELDLITRETRWDFHNRLYPKVQKKKGRKA